MFVFAIRYQFRYPSSGPLAWGRVERRGSRPCCFASVTLLFQICSFSICVRIANTYFAICDRTQGEGFLTTRSRVKGAARMQLLLYVGRSKLCLVPLKLRSNRIVGFVRPRVPARVHRFRYHDINSDLFCHDPISLFPFSFGLSACLTH